MPNFVFKRKIVKLLLLATLVMQQILSVARAQDAAIIDEIIVRGNERVSTATILSYLPIVIGDNVHTSTMNKAVDSLFDF